MDDKAFKLQIWRYYKQHGRDLPWRKNITPYRILVSEIMLQQTQVSRVLPKYKEFLRKFPSVPALAQSSAAEVLRVWSGLGYNRRALYLKQAAQVIMSKYKNKFPSTIEDLVQLPGVGRNTAGAVLAYAFNRPTVFIETNIRKVFLHHFFKNKSNVSDSQLVPFIEKTLDYEHPREWYWALMDYGNFLAATTDNPNIRSKHYTKQSKFAGSIRQLRGLILKYLLEHGSATSQVLKKIANDSRMPIAIQQLMVEGFLHKKSGRFYLQS